MTTSAKKLYLNQADRDPQRQNAVTRQLIQICAGYEASFITNAIAINPNGTGTTTELTIDDNLGGEMVYLRQWDAGGNGAYVAFEASNSSTVGTHAAVSDGRWLAELDFLGSDGTQFKKAADISVVVDGAVTTGHVPGMLLFRTTPAGGSVTLRLSITSAGWYGFGCTPETFFHIKDNGNVVTPTSTFIAQGITADKYLTGTAGSYNYFMQINNYSVDGFGDGINLFYSRGTEASPSAVQNGDGLGYLTVYGYNGTARAASSSIAFEVDAAPAAGVVPGRIRFYTAPLGGSQTERLRIDNKGNVTIGTAAVATNATDGFFYFTTGAGAPTGTPTAYTGRVPLYYDTTNNKLYVYNGAWKGVTLA